jgi:acyl transferase domain-containing protein
MCSDEWKLKSRPLSFGRAEAAAVIVLKPLQQALQDGDRIRGVILGTGINSSGSIAPVNAPVASAQEEAMRRAFQMAGRSPQHVSFLELHATGTARGDPTEANWAGKAFQRDGDLLIGSVKGNIGYVVRYFVVKLCSDHGEQSLRDHSVLCFAQ